MRQQMKVSVAILNWNRKDNTLDCLKHVYDLTYPLYQVIVVDNASTDGSVEAVREEYPEAIVVAKERNYGCSEGKNIGIRKASEANPDAIYYMDNDIVVDKDSLAELVKVLEKNPEAGTPMAALPAGIEVADISGITGLLISSATKLEYRPRLPRLNMTRTDLQESRYCTTMTVKNDTFWRHST